MSLVVPHDLLSRYDQPGPRYTSYPTAPVWSGDFGPEDHRASLLRANQQSGAGMSLYVHLPFCRSMCYYCGCSVIISRDPNNGDRYVDEVLREAALARVSLQASRPVVQHHWGGGTPTFLSSDQMVQCTPPSKYSGFRVISKSQMLLSGRLARRPSTLFTVLAG